MKFCKYEKCYWYGHEKRDKQGNIIQRKCYYEPGCWRGYLDMLIEIFRLWWRLRREKRHGKRAG